VAGGSRIEIKCVIFDFDLTLVNLSDFVDWGRAQWLIIQTYIKHGVSENLVRQHSQGGLLSLLNGVYEELLRRFSPDKAESIQAEAFKALEEWEAEGIFKARLMPRCLEALQWLKGKGLEIGIVSSNSDGVVNEILRLRGLDSFIDVVIARDVRYRLKPHPDQFIACMKKMGCEPQNTVAVGDTSRDMVAAREAGILAIGVLTGLTSKEGLSAAGAAKIIRSLHELHEALLTLDPALRR